MTGTNADDATDLTLVCALPPVDREGRRLTLRSIMRDSTTLIEEDDGVRIECLGTDRLAASLLEFVLAERQCCASFTYELRFAPDHSTVTFAVHATGAAVAPLKALYLGSAVEAGLHVE